ncbi:MAG: hypothetical protein ABFE02_06180 [Sulfuricella sp.]
MLPYKLTSTIVLLALTACASRYPLGIPEEQWQAMSTAQRLQAQEKHAELKRAEAERQAAEARAREAEAERQRAELETRRREARYGERVQCVLSNAEAYLGGKWRSIEPVALDLVQGMEISFNLAEPSGRTVSYRTPAYAYFDGQSVGLCRDADDDRRNPSTCARVLGTFADYRRGFELRIDAQRFLRGRMRCDLVPAQDMPRRRDYR